MSTDFAMPDLGEGLTESELVAWHVTVGELVELNQPIAEVETAKAIVQLPSPFAGTISQLYVEPGTVVAVGSRLVAFDLTDEADAPVERNSMLVGYGPPVETDNRPKRKARGAAAPSGRVAADEVGVIETPAPEPTSYPVRTTPPVRKFARDLGVDLATVTATGDGGLVTRADVQAAAAVTSTAAASPAPSPAAATSYSPPAIARTAEESKAARGTRPRERRTPRRPWCAASRAHRRPRCS
jgi:2-oxoisovalerate dehydrogenase E2 component (dihydrolipoyl transacylase)